MAFTKKRFYDPHLIPQHYYICNSKHTILVDFIARFETFQTDMNQIKQKLNLNHPIQHLNQTNRVQYIDAYNDDMIQKVGALYQADIQLFNYSYPLD